MINDPLEKRLDSWSDAVNEWKALALEAAEAEGKFKRWKSLRKLTLMNAGRSGVLAEAMTEAHVDYEENWMTFNEASINAEAAKKQIEIAKASWETERSNQVSLRAVK